MSNFFHNLPPLVPYPMPVTYGRLPVNVSVGGNTVAPPAKSRRVKYIVRDNRDHKLRGPSFSIEVIEHSTSREISPSGWMEIERRFHVRPIDVRVMGHGSTYGAIQLFHGGPGNLIAELTAGRLAQNDACPKCGVKGVFQRTALTCPTHGAFGGF